MKNGQGSAASTVAASTASGGSTSNFGAHVMPNIFVASRTELKDWEVWRNIRGHEGHDGWSKGSGQSYRNNDHSTQTWTSSIGSGLIVIKKTI